MELKTVTKIIFGIIILILSKEADAKQSTKGLTSSDVLTILQKERFRIVDRVSQIPTQPLISAKVILPTRKLYTYIVDKNQEFQRGDDSIDFDKPTRQIIMAGISPHYLFLCFWRGGDVEWRYLMLLKLSGVEAKVIFYSTLDGQIRSFSDIKQLLRENKVSILTFDSSREPETLSKGNNN